MGPYEFAPSPAQVDEGGRGGYAGRMTTLPNRPNTALLVVDVQNGVVAGAHQRDAVVANVAALVEKARRARAPVVWVQHFSEEFVRGDRPLADRPRAGSSRRRAPGREGLRRCFRGHHARERARQPRRRPPDRRRRPDRRVYPLDPPWGARQGLRRHPGQGRPHDRGPDRLGRAAADQVIAHTNLYWTYETAPGRTGGTVQTSDVDFSRAG